MRRGVVPLSLRLPFRTIWQRMPFSGPYLDFIMGRLPPAPYCTYIPEGGSEPRLPVYREAIPFGESIP